MDEKSINHLPVYEVHEVQSAAVNPTFLRLDKTLLISRAQTHVL